MTAGTVAQEITADGRWQPIRVEESCTRAEWDSYVEAHPLGTVDHLWGWQRIFRDVFRQEPTYLTAWQSDVLVGVLPLVAFRSALFGRFIVSLPFLNYGGLLTSMPQAGPALAAQALRLAQRSGASHVEFRHRSPQLPGAPSRSHKVGIRRQLPATSDALWSDIDRKARNQIRKAQKEGLTTHVGGGELVDDFYPVFARNMRDLGTPVYTRSLFTTTLDEFADRGRIFVVRLGGKAIAAGITLRCRDVVLVPWASSLRDYRHLCANMLLYWTMLEHSIATGARVFDFGRSSPGAGTHAFKTQWGGVETPLHWEYQLLTRHEAPDQGPANPRFAMAISTWKRLPLWLTTSIGPRIVRHIA